MFLSLWCFIYQFHFYKAMWLHLVTDGDSLKSQTPSHMRQARGVWNWIVSSNRSHEISTGCLGLTDPHQAWDNFFVTSQRASDVTTDVIKWNVFYLFNTDLCPYKQFWCLACMKFVSFNIWVRYFAWNFKDSLEIPHRISYPYIERCAFYLDVII